MKNQRYLLVGGLAILIAAMVAGLLIATWAESSSPHPRKGHEMKTVRAESIVIKGTVAASGTLVAREVAVISSRVTGYVTDLTVDAGAHVKSGQVLLRIDTKELADRKAQAKADLDSANASFADAKKDFERYKPLFQSHAISKQQYDEIRARYEVAEAAKQRAQEALNQAETQLAYGEVRSPFSGIIGERSVNVGDLVMEGRPLLTVYVPGTLELVAPVGEQYARFVKEGTRVEVSIPSLGVKQATRIREVVPQTNQQTRTITVKAPLSDAPGLTPGIYGTLSFDTETSEVVAVPSRAIRTVGQLESVKVYRDGREETRYVKTGRALKGDKVEILSGLRPGEQVVID